ncbi:hypothetical protein GCQ56_06480 [Marinifilum sp. N1E240]|uniref:hypothetical protein n=1 Tax=Marinifilum sp. N1E240 TaxID=2608082 RepID=UPI00128DD744|nr:hypothetical protein [Marinifilum sp. N1E240]MPQ46655.1 hypothetical protein [Marinifilum sp. N1E240]
MKFKVLITCVALLATSVCVSAQANHKRFLVKSGHIEMKVVGISEGVRSIWFDDYGRQYRDELKVITTTEIFGIKTVEEAHTLKIVNGEDFYSADLILGTGTKHSYGIPTEFYQAYDQMSEFQKDKFANEIFNDIGGTKLGVGTMLGRKCDIIKVLGVTETIYKGVALQTKVRMLGKINTETATLFEENISVPSFKFSAPQDIEWTDLNAVVDIYADSDDDDQDSYQDDDEDMIPVSYSFERFKKATQDIEYAGFKKAMTMNVDGQYMTSYMKSMKENFVIVASSIENMHTDSAAEGMDKYQHFSHDGRKMHFGDAIDEEEGEIEGNALIIEYPKEDMIISIVSTYKLSKGELLKIAEQLKF